MGKLERKVARGKTYEGKTDGWKGTFPGGGLKKVTGEKKHREETSTEKKVGRQPQKKDREGEVAAQTERREEV